MKKLKEIDFDRFYTDENLFTKYNELKKADNVLYDYYPKLFLLSAVLGYKYNQRKELNRPKQLVQKSAVLNSEYAEIVYNSFKLIAYKEEERDENGFLNVKKVMEEYAKGGFEKIYDEILLRKSDSKTKDLIDHLMIYC